MRYNLDSTLPINAFFPRGGRGPFARGMTLEGGGGGGGVLGGITKTLGQAVGGITKGVQAVVQPVYNATLKQIPGVDQALVGLDKSVASTIPGGWGTVAAVASSFIPGSAFAANGLLSGITRTGLSVGLGALSGSGVMHKGNQFNLQGAIMGGALAYGASQIAEGIQNAANPGAAKAVEEAAKEGVVEGGKSALTGTGSEVAKGASTLTPTANAMSNISDVPNVSEYYKPPTPSYTPSPGDFTTPSSSSFGNIKDVASGSGDFGLRSIASTPSGLGASAAPDMLSRIGSGASNAVSLGGDTLSNMGSSTYNAAKNIIGAGAPTIGETASAFANPITPMGIGSGIMGASGLMAMEEQKKQLQEQYAQGNIAQEEYNKELSAIDEQIKTAREAVAAHPFDSNPDVSGSLSGSGTDNPKAYQTAYAPTEGSSTRLYAYGGMVNQPGMVNPPDDQTGMPSQSPLSSDFGLSNLYGSMQPPPASAGSPQSFYPPTNNYGGAMGFAGGGEVPRFAFGGSYSASASDSGSLGPVSGGGGFFSTLAPFVANYVGAIGDPVGSRAEMESQAVGRQAVKDQPYNFDSKESKPTISIGIQGLNRGSPTDLLYPQKRTKLNYELPEYAAGGMAPRFLSGGGDGMSDSIKANIGGTQEARLADGEFVIPADVVSHLGNGSSKAGAKQLYSMMDRVRKVRTGTKKQGKQINPRKYMSA
jgi:hypothetical protein